MFSPLMSSKIFQSIVVVVERSLRNRADSMKILQIYGPIYRPEVQTEFEHLAVQTVRNKSLDVNYELEQQRRRQRTVRYHILRRKYVAHPNDVQVNVFVKNHMQFLHKNYPQRWNVEMLSESFNQSVENVRLILRQRTRRRLRVRALSPSSLFSIRDEEEREMHLQEHQLKRDLRHNENNETNEDPVDYRILAEESDILPRQRPSDDYLKKKNDGFFSNVLSSSESRNDRLLSSPSTLLDRMNKVRLDNRPLNDSSFSTETSSDLHEKRWQILQTMQRNNDAIAELNERREKYLSKKKTNKNDLEDR